MNLAAAVIAVSNGARYINTAQEIVFTAITKGYFTGDSIAAGANASPLSNSYRSKLITEYGWTEVNLASSGRGVWLEMSSLLDYTFLSTDVVFPEGALNDIRRSHSAETFNKIESCRYTALCNIFLGTDVASGSASVTRAGGAFTAFDAAQYGGTYGSGAIPGNVATSVATIGATWTYNFTGQNVFVQFNASYPGATRGNCEVRIDGVLVDTITDLSNRYDGVSDSVNANQFGPDTRLYRTTPGSHTIEVRATENETVVLDRIGTLGNPPDKAIVFVIEVPKITDYSAVGLDQASDAYINQVNALLEEIVDRFYNLRFRIKFIHINTGSGGMYSLITGIDADGIHPNNTGHNQIFQTIKSHIIE